MSRELNIRRKAFVHGGIGINYKPLAKKIIHDCDFKLKVKSIYDLIGIDIGQSVNYHDDNDSINNQLLSYAINCYINERYHLQGYFGDFQIGHSMGLYSCLYSAGFYEYETGVQIIYNVYRSIKNHFDGKGYCLGCVMGISEDRLTSLLKKYNCEICIDNGYDNFVVNGKRDSVTRLLNDSLDLGAKFVKYIKSQLPYHSQVMNDIRSILNEDIYNIYINKPYDGINVYSMVTANKINYNNCLESILDMICNRIRFCYCIYHISTHMTNIFYEIGPKDKLGKLISQINPHVTIE